MKKYIKDGMVFPANQIVIKTDGYQIINPSEEVLIENGWSEYVSQDNPPIEDVLEGLRKKLSESDYKIIKCIEAHFCAEDLPYDIIALHDERNELRRQINELEHENENF